MSKLLYRGDPVPGPWQALFTVLTHQELPDEYMMAPSNHTATLLSQLRNNTSAKYNDIGMYMFQIEDLSFHLVRACPVLHSCSESCTIRGLFVPNEN